MVTTSTNGVIYGLYLCLGDVSNDICQRCFSYLRNFITSRCPTKLLPLIDFRITIFNTECGDCLKMLMEKVLVCRQAKKRGSDP
ncbi:hypothetical protein CFP56_042911 [Quercus suber]|uniref:Gnk2-homologous domain-containing protein n=1 Tax=Quercus suber TaxID=58331 RepID=A0AAW0LII6_QUESU